MKAKRYRTIIFFQLGVIGECNSPTSITSNVAMNEKVHVVDPLQSLKQSKMNEFIWQFKMVADDAM